MAGRKVRCPSCNAVLVIPQPKPAGDVEDEALQLLLDDSGPKQSKESYSIRAEPPTPAKPVEEGIRRAEPAARAAKPPAPVKKAKPRGPKTWSRETESEGGGGFSIAVHPSISSGLLMVVGGALWFCVGMANGRLYPYSAVLVVLGIGAIIRGFTGKD